MGILWRPSYPIDIKQSKNRMPIEDIRIQRKRGSLKRRLFRQMFLHKMILCKCDGTHSEVQQCAQEILEMEMEMYDMQQRIEDEEEDAVPTNAMRSGGNVIPFKPAIIVPSEIPEKDEAEETEYEKCTKLYNQIILKARRECHDDALHVLKYYLSKF